MGQAAQDRINGNACERCGTFLWEGEQVVLGAPNGEETTYHEEDHRNIGFPIYHTDCAQKMRDNDA